MSLHAIIEICRPQTDLQKISHPHIVHFMMLGQARFIRRNTPKYSGQRSIVVIGLTLLNLNLDDQTLETPKACDLEVESRVAGGDRSGRLYATIDSDNALLSRDLVIAPWPNLRRNSAH